MSKWVAKMSSRVAAILREHKCRRWQHWRDITSLTMARPSKSAKSLPNKAGKTAAKAPLRGEEAAGERQSERQQWRGWAHRCCWCCCSSCVYMDRRKVMRDRLLENHERRRWRSIRKRERARGRRKVLCQKKTSKKEKRKSWREEHFWSWGLFQSFTQPATETRGKPPSHFVGELPGAIVGCLVLYLKEESFVKTLHFGSIIKSQNKEEKTEEAERSSGKVFYTKGGSYQCLNCKKPKEEQSNCEQQFVLCFGWFGETSVQFFGHLSWRK